MMHKINENPNGLIISRQVSRDNFGAFAHRLLSVTFFLSFIAIGIGIAVFIFDRGIQIQTVSGKSMEPTYHNGDQILVNKFPVSIGSIGGSKFMPKRFDTVIIEHQNRGDIELLVKRVIGLPDETVTIQNGAVMVANAAHPNGFIVDRDNLNLEKTFTESPFQMKLGPNQVFVLGDNRGAGGSQDSRGALGAVPIKNIIGRAVFRTWPLQRFGPAD